MFVMVSNFRNCSDVRNGPECRNCFETHNYFELIILLMIPISKSLVEILDQNHLKTSVKKRTNITKPQKNTSKAPAAGVYRQRCFKIFNFNAYGVEFCNMAVP